MMNKPQIMGILNTTPDSFSDGGAYINVKDALIQVKRMIDEGAKIIDVGGESTRPGASFVTAETECERIIPIIKAIKENFDILVSVDTYKSDVAQKAIDAGADIINDIWGNKYDGKMIDVICKNNVPYIWMHNKNDTDYLNIINEIKEDYKQFYNELTKRNYNLENLYFDPGIGFGKTPEQNLYILANLQKFMDIPTKKLLGTSRKSVYKYALNIEEAQDRDFATALTSFDAVQYGFDIIRVHNVKINFDAIEFAWAMQGAKNEFDQ